MKLRKVIRKSFTVSTCDGIGFKPYSAGGSICFLKRSFFFWVAVAEAQALQSQCHWTARGIQTGEKASQKVGRRRSNFDFKSKCLRIRNCMLENTSIGRNE